jgi:hypothetical protein
MAQAAYMQAANSFAMLDLTADFSPRRENGGFFSQRRGATIMALDLPREAYDSFAANFERELEKRGYGDVRRSRLPGRADEHLYFFAHQDSPVGRFDKHMLIIRNAERALYVTLTVNPPEQTENPLSPLEAMNILASARIAHERKKVRAGYGLDYLGGFIKSEAMAGETGVYVPAKSNIALPAGSIRPVFIVAPSISRRPLDDLANASRRLIVKFKRFSNVALEAEEKREIDGLPAYGLAGRAVNRANGEEVGIYQMLIKRPGGGYFRLVGIAPLRLFPSYRKRFRRMAASFYLARN